MSFITNTSDHSLNHKSRLPYPHLLFPHLGMKVSTIPNYIATISQLIQFNNKSRHPSPHPFPHLGMEIFVVKDNFDKVFDQFLTVSTVKENFDQKLKLDKLME